MAVKVWTVLLVLAVFGAFSFKVKAAPSEDSASIYEETDLDDGQGGSIHDVREVDARCRYERNTDTFPDGSSSQVLDDFVHGKGVVLTSNATDECLVRDLDPEEKQESDTCKDGLVVREKSQPDEEQRDYVKSDTALTEAERDLLPQTVKDVCEGKTIFKLVAKAAGDDAQGEEGQEGQVRHKRAFRYCYRCYYRYRCYIRCYTRWGRRYCHRYCHRYRYCQLRLCYYG